MKKQCFFAITAFALAGLLFLIGCSTGNDDNVIGDIIDKTALQKKITEAKEERDITDTGGDLDRVPLGRFWATPEIKENLQRAIDTADNALAYAGSQPAVNSAITALDYAITFFKNARRPGTADPIDLSALNAKIAKAESKRLIVIINYSADNVAQGDYWVSQLVMTNFGAAISSARNTLSGAQIQPELTQAENALEAAITTFTGERQTGSKTTGFSDGERTALIMRANTTRTGVKTSTANGDDVGPSGFWASQSDLNILDVAIATAQSATGNIDTACLALVAAINTFNEAKKQGTLQNKTPLFDAIRSANEAKNGVAVAANASQAPYNMSWATRVQWAPLNTAYNNALAVASNYNASKNAVDAALSALTAATSVFTATVAGNGPGTKQNSITITGLGSLAFPDDTYISVGLFLDMNNINYSTPQIIGGDIVQNGTVTIDLNESSGIPWAGTGSWFVFFTVEADFPLYISKTAVNFTANPNPSRNFSDFKKHVFSVKLGGIDQYIFYYPSQTMTLDQWFVEAWGISYTEYLESDGGTFYKNEALTQAFNGNDTVNANTVIYTEYPIGGGGNYRGAKIGEITGTISLTNISIPPPRVYIGAYGRDNDSSWGSYYSEINMSGVSGTSATLNWSIPVYEYDYFVAGETTFYLRVRPAGGGGSFDVSIPTTKNITSYDENAGSLGTVSIAFITLSGTINVRFDGETVPYVEITAITDGWIGLTSLSSPGANALWSIVMPPFDTPTEIYFRATGFSNNNGDWNDLLFEKDFVPNPSTVHDQDRAGIQINLGDIPHPFNPVNETQLTNGLWVNDSLSNADDVVWYSIQVSAGQAYHIWWNDSDNSAGDKTADILVSAYRSKEYRIFSEDGGWETSQEVYANVDGIVYLRVSPRISASIGTYGIVYSTSSTRPGN